MNVTPHKRITCVAVNAILFALLLLSVSFNKEYLRLAFMGNPVLDLLTGSCANFIAAYLISLFSACPILSRKFGITRQMQIFLATSVGVFIALTIEELVSVLGASKVRDGNDIIASALGSFCAIFTFLFLRRAVSRRNNKAEIEEAAPKLDK